MVWLELLLDGLLLLVFGFVMARDMRRNPGAGFFHPVMRGFLPVALVSALSFFAMQGGSQELQRYQEAFVAEYGRAAAALPGGVWTPEQARTAAELLFRLQPGIQCVFWLAVLTAAAAVIRKRLVRQGQVLPAPPLSRWKAPDHLIWLVLLPGAVVLFGDRGWLGEVEEWLRDLCLNLLVVALSIYLFQGLMVVVERLHQMGLPKPLGLLLASSALALGVLPQGRGATLLLLALGLLETWFDLRGLGRGPRDSRRGI